MNAAEKTAAAHPARFAGKVVLVTGAVRNTGLAIAEAFAREGASVILNGRRADAVRREAERIREETGADIMEGVCDIARQEAVDALFAQIRERYGRLDVLVNNAVLQAQGYTLLDNPRSVLEETFATNIFGVYACSQGAARLMAEQGHGAIVNIGSNTAERAIKGRTVYVASKAAVDGLTRAMAVELGPMGIHVNMVVAGYIRTPRWDVLPPGAAERRRANVPLGREATGDDIARAVLFLASEEASCIQGARLAVDGGSLAQLYPADCDC